MNNLTASPLLVGCAAGFSGDRTDAAGPVVDTLIARMQHGPAGQRAFLIFETLAERTLALAQLRRRADPEAGYEPLLDAMLRPVLARCLAHGIRIVSNFGAANPRAAARHIARMARELGVAVPRIAVVEGDDLSAPAQRAMLRERLGAEMDAHAGGQRQCLHRRRTDRRCARCRCADRGVRARRRPVADGRAGDVALRLAFRRLGPARRAPPWPATCSNAVPRSAAATSRTPATRMCPDWRRSAFPLRRSTPTAAASSARPMPRAACSARPRSRSNCCTRCTTRRPT